MVPLCEAHKQVPKIWEEGCPNFSEEEKHQKTIVYHTPPPQKKITQIDENHRYHNIHQKHIFTFIKSFFKCCKMKIFLSDIKQRFRGIKMGFLVIPDINMFYTYLN
jgi:hypothetical protein